MDTASMDANPIDEDLEDIDENEKTADPLRNAKISKNIDGTEFIGHVEDIEMGKVSKERLYRIRYNDGDLEHYTAAQVEQFRTPDEQPEVLRKPSAPIEAEAKEATDETTKADNARIEKKPAAQETEQPEEAVMEEEPMEVDQGGESVRKKPAMEASISKKPAARVETEPEEPEEEPEEAPEEALEEAEDAEEAEEAPMLKKPAAVKAVPPAASPKKSAEKASAKASAKSTPKALPKKDNEKIPPKKDIEKTPPAKSKGKGGKAVLKKPSVK